MAFKYNPFTCTLDLVDGVEDLVYKVIDGDYEMTIDNNIIVVKNTTGNIVITLPSIYVVYKKQFYIVNESNYDVTLQARCDDIFYDGSDNIILNTLGQSIQLLAFSGWNILNRYIP